MKLIGKHEYFERFKESYTPSRSIFVGNLKGVNDVDLIDSKSGASNSLSLKFLLKDHADKINVNLSLSIFYRVYPTFDEQNKFIDIQYDDRESYKKFDIANIWKRKDISINPIVFDKSDSVKFSLKPYIDDILMSDELFLSDETIQKIPADVVDDDKKYNEFIENINKLDKSFLDWEVEVSFKTQNFSQDGDNLKLCTISLVNLSVNPENNPKLYEGDIFAPSFKIDLNSNVPVPFRYNYEHEGYKRVYEQYLRCINCQGELKNNIITTCACPTSNKEKVSPKNKLEGVDISFKTLSTEKGLNELDKIHKLMEEHIEDSEKYYENNKTEIKNDEEYLEEISNFKKMKDTFVKGINLLKDKENSNALKSFLLMNKAFEENSEKYDSWRLFQIVFIVSELIDVVCKETPKDSCSLLHVMTGGGKSEAYFGLVIFSAFYDRISGKEFGVTAFTKFPLRMLSIQQLQRIANIFIWAEKIREDENLGGEPFSIAYYVGSTGDEFPDYNYKVIEIIEKNKKEGKLTRGKIIDKCPICKDEDNPLVYLDIDQKNKTVIHKCSKCGREYRLYFSDDEIYRMIPTFIVSTVDKLAAVSMNRRFKNLFGGKLDICPDGHGFNSRKDICFYKDINAVQCKKSGGPRDVKFSTGPSLMIQDEMHLIREGFGTIDSHFESTFEELQMEMTGSSFKRIAITATVAGAKNQIKELYDKETVVFPPHLINSKDEDFFFIHEKDDTNNSYEDDNKKNPIIQRRIIGIKPNRSVISPLTAILRYSAQFFKYLDENLEKFAEEKEFDVDELTTIKEYYKQILTYHKKKDATQIVNYFAESFINGREDSFDIEARPLTGENDLDYIKETIDLVENYYKNGNNKEKLLAVNATSIVSHGVDIDKWNFMIFDGLPNNTSGYIQALSRVGRQKFGIVFLTFVPHRTRDLSFYHHFTEYHDILDDKVENVALSRWTKLGFDQTFTSIFLGALMSYLSNEYEKPIYRVKDVREIFIENNENVNNVKRRHIKKEPLEKLVNFLHKAYLTDHDAVGSKYFRERIKKETEDRIIVLADYGISKNNSKVIWDAIKHNDKKNYNTQMGMRGIQDEITLIPHASEGTFRYNWG
ncbi:MAG: hypothetical protein IKV87_07850 [Methanobrevibacter sp.]|nr:hypothetical protein [Methanobrevibacter sp.]